MDLKEFYAPFLRHVPAGTQILDAGCGSGRDSAAFLAQGYEVLAIDASPTMVRAAQRIGTPAKVMTFQGMQFDAEFDGI